PVVAAQVYLADAYDDLFAAIAAVLPELAATLPGDRESLLAPQVLGETMHAIRDALIVTDGFEQALRAHLLALPDARRRAKALTLLDVYASCHDRYFNFFGPTGTIRTVDYDAVLRGEVGGFAGQIVLVGLVEP